MDGAIPQLVVSEPDRATAWRLSRMTNGPDEVVDLIREAEVSRDLNDDCQLAGAPQPDLRKPIN